MLYNAILMDADDTLFDFRAAERLAIMETLIGLGLNDPAAAELYVRINEACWKDFELGKITQSELQVKRFSQLLSALSINAEPRAVGDTYLASLSKQWILLPGAEEALAEIAACHPVAIVTNGIAGVQRSRFESSPIHKYIKTLVISEEYGLPKPYPGIFLHALSLLGNFTPDRALMIGDSLTSDMTGAIAAGVNTCWFNPGCRPCPDDMAINHIISKIEDMPRIALS
jgi:YjjG family noncanonical pyrimidine nucleotidase